MKKPKVIETFNKTVKMKCPNCGESVLVAYGKNRWVEWFQGQCWTCGWRFILKDTEFDFVQPSSPFFKLIYNNDPEKETIKRKKLHEWEEQKKKEELERKYYDKYRGGNVGSAFKTAEKKALIKEVLE